MLASAWPLSLHGLIEKPRHWRWIDGLYQVYVMGGLVFGESVSIVWPSR